MTGHTSPPNWTTTRLYSYFSLILIFLCFLLTCCHGEITHVCSGGSVPLEPELDCIKVLDESALHGHCETPCS